MIVEVARLALNGHRDDDFFFRVNDVTDAFVLFDGFRC